MSVGEDGEQTVDSAQRPDRGEGCSDQRQRRSGPHQHEQRLTILNDAIDGLECSEEVVVVKFPMPGMTTTANANRKPATSEHKSAATSSRSSKVDIGRP